MKPAIRTTVITIASVGIFILSPHPNLPIIPVTKNPTNVGLDGLQLFSEIDTTSEGWVATAAATAAES